MYCLSKPGRRESQSVGQNILLKISKASNEEACIQVLWWRCIQIKTSRSGRINIPTGHETVSRRPWRWCGARCRQCSSSSSSSPPSSACPPPCPRPPGRGLSPFNPGSSPPQLKPLISLLLRGTQVDQSQVQSTVPALSLSTCSSSATSRRWSTARPGLQGTQGIQKKVLKSATTTAGRILWNTSNTTPPDNSPYLLVLWSFSETQFSSKKYLVSRFNGRKSTGTYICRLSQLCHRTNPIVGGIWKAAQSRRHCWKIEKRRTLRFKMSPQGR